MWGITFSETMHVRKTVSLPISFCREQIYWYVKLNIYHVGKFGVKSELSWVYYGNAILWVKRITYTIRIYFKEIILLLPLL